MTSAINPSVANGANNLSALSQTNLDNVPDSSEANPSDSYYSDFKTTRSNASNDSTYNVSASDVNPAANRNGLQLADGRNRGESTGARTGTQINSTPRQSTQDRKDNAGGRLGGMNLGINFLNKQKIRSDITNTADRIDQNIRNGGANTGTLVSVTVDKGHLWNGYKDSYSRMSASSGSSTPPTANANGSYREWGDPNQKTGYVWVSNNKPESLPSNVSWMTPAQFRNMANAFTI
jgi:hypothetical protein